MQKNEENSKYLHRAFRKHLLEEDLPCLRTEMSPVAILISLSKITAGQQRSVSVILSSNDISDYDYLWKREG